MESQQSFFLMYGQEVLLCFQRNLMCRILICVHRSSAVHSIDSSVWFYLQMEALSCNILQLIHILLSAFWSAASYAPFLSPHQRSSGFPKLRFVFSLRDSASGAPSALFRYYVFLWFVFRSKLRLNLRLRSPFLIWVVHFDYTGCMSGALRLRYPHSSSIYPCWY